MRRFLHPPEHLRFREAPASGACLVFNTDDLDPARIEASYRLLATDPHAGPVAAPTDRRPRPFHPARVALPGAVT